jgi:hypothetical protein
MTLQKLHRQRRGPLPQPRPQAVQVAEAGELVQVAAVDVASEAAVAAVAVFAAGAGQRARVSAVKEAAVAIGPIRYHRLVSASWIRTRYPRSSRSHRRSPRSARSSCVIAAKPLHRLPKLSATADRLASNRHG